MCYGKPGSTVTNGSSIQGVNSRNDSKIFKFVWSIQIKGYKNLNLFFSEMRVIPPPILILIYWGRNNYFPTTCNMALKQQHTMYRKCNTKGLMHSNKYCKKQKQRTKKKQVNKNEIQGRVSCCMTCFC